MVVSFTGRDNKTVGLGSGFVISADGLIATNLHVIGEARPIFVQTADGKKHPVTEIHATDRVMDLAILKIAATNLQPLLLGDSTTLEQGEDIVALGNPEGLTFSVVRGVVSGRRDIDGKPMIQLAIPIEPGNSGGPMLDRFGRVHGILTMKSLVTRNLGFAVEINALKPLLKQPNPIPLSRWLTIGTLDSREWQTLFGANWRQRAGRIQVEGMGDGFGGRSLALRKSSLRNSPMKSPSRCGWMRKMGQRGWLSRRMARTGTMGFIPAMDSCGSADLMGRMCFPGRCSSKFAARITIRGNGTR